LWEAVSLERGPLSLEELLERKRSGSGVENWDYCRRDPSHSPRGTLYTQKLALTSPTKRCRSADIVRSQTQATEFSYERLDLFKYFYLKIRRNTQLDTHSCIWDSHTVGHILEAWS
jgi:hypothetical protein